MPVRWYVLQGELKQGPFSSRQLKQLADQGKISDTDIILKGETSNPQPAGRIKGLFDPISRTAAASSQVSISSEDNVGQSVPLSSKSRTLFFPWFVTGIVLLCLFVVSWIIWSRPDSADKQISTNVVAPDVSDSAEHDPDEPLPDKTAVENEVESQKLLAEGAGAGHDVSEISPDADRSAGGKAVAEPLEEAIPPNEPDSKNLTSPHAPKPPTPIKLVDLEQVVRSAGYRAFERGTVIQYLRFGLAANAAAASTSGQFSVLEQERKAEAHREKVATQTFLIRDCPIKVLYRNDFERNGLMIVCQSPMRLGSLGRDTATNTRGELAKIWLYHADLWDYWFLTKNKTLRQCQNSDEVAVVQQNNGIIYHPEGFSSKVVLQSYVDLKTAKAIYDSPKDYSVDLVVEQLEMVNRKKFQQRVIKRFIRRDILEYNDWNEDSLLR